MAGSAWLGYQLVMSPSFQATGVVVTGADLAPAEWIVHQLGLSGTNIFWVRSRELEHILEAHPAIAAARVRPTLSGVVHVEVEERVPVVAWEAGGRVVLADAQGLVLAPVDRELPAVHAPGPSPPIGARVDAAAVQLVQRLAPHLERLGLSGGRLEYQPGLGISVVAGDHRLTLGWADQIEAKLEAYRAIRRYLEESRTPYQLIDLRAPDRPYIR